MTESPAIEPDDFRFRLLCDMWSHESDLIDAGSDVGLHGGACGQFCGFEVFDTCDGGQGHQRTCDGEFDKFVVFFVRPCRILAENSRFVPEFPSEAVHRF